MKISEHFTLEEFTSSSTASRLRIANTPSDDVKENLRKLCTLILEPARSSLGKGIRISSGFRCPRLNRAVGGVPNSQHQTGCAADIYLPDSGYADTLFSILKSNPHTDQLLYERNSAGTRWIHVSYSESPRHQASHDYRV